MSWLPGTQRAVPGLTMFRTSRSVSRIRGPAIHQIAEEDRLAALGMAVDRSPQTGSSLVKLHGS